MTHDDLYEIFSIACGTWNVDPASSAGKARSGAWWLAFRNLSAEQLRGALQTCEQCSPDRFPTVPQLKDILARNRQKSWLEQRKAWKDSPLSARQWWDLAHDLAETAARNAERHGKKTKLSELAEKYAEAYAENARRVERGDAPKPVRALVSELTAAIGDIP